MDTKFVESPDGTRIAFDVTGAGPGLMLLHGAGKTRQDWHRTGYVDRLKKDFTVVSVDIRGTGESSFLTEIGDYAIEKICDDLNAVADSCDLPEFFIWGFSFGGNIARYMGAWSSSVKGIAIIGVPFGPAVDEAFDRFIDDFIEKYGSLAEDYAEGSLTSDKRRSAVKGGIPVWAACFQAMREWPVIDPGDINCPALLLAGAKNTNVINWLTANREAVEDARIRVELIKNLTHQQEFSEIDLVFPWVSSFFKEQL